jgi:NAD(P)-dependent dehydrogenase (short-subunit alcohol dehydrogenase family)
MHDLDSKVVLITGGCGDIGSATARLLAAEGAKVYLSDILEQSAGRAKSEQLGAAGYFKCDQSDRAATEAMVQDIVQKAGRIDIAIANAAVVTKGMFPDVTVEDWQRVMDTNVTGCFHMAQVCVRAMLKQERDQDNVRGRVMFTSSWNGRYPLPGGIGYVVSKAAIDGFVRVLAQELSHEGILVNAVAPGLLYAGLTRMLCDKTTGLKEKLQDMVPLGELGTADQVGQLYAFLCSSKSAYITGQILYVDGGASVIKRELPLPDRE